MRQAPVANKSVHCYEFKATRITSQYTINLQLGTAHIFSRLQLTEATGRVLEVRTDSAEQRQAWVPVLVRCACVSFCCTRTNTCNKHVYAHTWQMTKIQESIDFRGHMETSGNKEGHLSRARSIREALDHGVTC